MALYCSLLLTLTFSIIEDGNGNGNVYMSRFSVLCCEGVNGAVSVMKALIKHMSERLITNISRKYSNIFSSRLNLVAQSLTKTLE
ncbi:Hypothetical predicted protein [Octopus vulgaris]|uniref:Secreted protein n=1 Tax=Octopus vulgaris TaxID=6645 RepID=A0AA36B4B9_OCTVU|nr:Hypothetical predicted protein [Octopus vulgaris]